MSFSESVNQTVSQHSKVYVAKTFTFKLCSKDGRLPPEENRFGPLEVRPARISSMDTNNSDTKRTKDY